MTDQTPGTTWSLTVLWALCKIEVDILESIDVSDKTDCEFECANNFFDAFKGDMYKKRDVRFIYESAPNRTWMILDKNFNEVTLTMQESK